MPGCHESAEHKAPKHRGLNEYHYFCLEHVRDYNKAWNFFSGMAESEVQEHILKSMYGDRPTWRYGVDGENPEDILRRKIHEAYGGQEEHSANGTNNTSGQAFGIDRNSPEFEALALMGITPPTSLEDIKVRYKMLVKKHHPDLNKGCPKSEELLKRINMAYTLLKVAYEDFETLKTAGER